MGVAPLGLHFGMVCDSRKAEHRKQVEKTEYVE